MYNNIYREPNKKSSFNKEKDDTVHVEIDDNPHFEITNDIYVVNTDQFDLDSITTSYSGYARILRLVYVAYRCPNMCRPALRLAIRYVQADTVNVRMYNRLLQRYQLLPVDGRDFTPELSLDKEWLENVFVETNATLEKLDYNLKKAKLSDVKERIRKNHNEIGDFYLKIGDLHNSLKSYGRSRDYCTDPEHTVTMCIKIGKVSLYMKNWDSIACYVRKAENCASQVKSFIQTNNAQFVQLNLMSGIAELCMENYVDVANMLLSTVFDSCDFPDMLSHSSIATYGTLCALSCFSREQLLKNISHNSSFKLFLDLEPRVKDLFYHFLNSRYADSLAILASMKNQLLLDMYIGRHVEKLYEQIRDRAFTQYFDPFSCACIKTMSSKFSLDIRILEGHLIRLINSGKIKARIDTVEKMVYVNCEDKRMQVYLATLNAMEHCRITSKLTLVRAAMNKARIEVKVSSRRVV